MQAPIDRGLYRSKSKGIDACGAIAMHLKAHSRSHPIIEKQEMANGMLVFGSSGIRLLLILGYDSCYSVRIAHCFILGLL